MSDDSRPKSPHDALFRAIFATPSHMAEELRIALPSELSAAIHWGSLRSEPGRFADADLEGAETDLLFSANTTAGPALVYVLVEHQSAPDRFMPLRLVRYVGRILDAHRRRYPAAPLPPVLPVVLCHARRPWPYPTDLASLYSVAPLPDAWRPHVIDFRFVLDDLARTPSLALAARPVSPLVAITLFVLKVARHTPDLLHKLEEIAHVFAELERSSAPDEQRSAIFSYIWATKRIDIAETRAFVRRNAWPKLEAIVITTADMLREEGRREGRGEGLKEGLARGEAKALVLSLRSKFGLVPAAVEHTITSADIPQLERWLTRVHAAASVEDVLRED